MAAAVLFYVLGSAAEVKASNVPMQPEDKQGGAVPLSPAAYALKAIAAVQKNLATGNEAAEDLRFELASSPIMKPDCSEYHSGGSTPVEPERAAARMPEAFVHINVFRGNVFKDRAAVVFMNGKPEVRFYGQKSSLTVYSVGAMDEAEIQQVSSELDPFFKTAVDVSRSSERFYAFLPLNIRALLKHPDRKFRLNMPPGAVEPSWRMTLLKEAVSRNTEPDPLDGLDSWKKELSDKDLRLFIALTLDLAVQQNWLALEGLEVDPDTRLQPKLLVSEPKDYIKILEKTVQKNRQSLEKKGALAPSHFRATCDYIQQMIGQSLIVKEVSRPEPCPCFLLPFSGEGFISGDTSELEVMQNLPEDAKLYLFGIAGLRLHFSDVESYPRLVCIAQN